MNIHPDVLSQVLLYVNNTDLNVMKNNIDEKFGDYFMQCGYLSLVKLAHSKEYEISLAICAMAARNEHYNILQWIGEGNIKWDIGISHIAEKCYSEICHYLAPLSDNGDILFAIEFGNLEALSEIFAIKENNGWLEWYVS